ncbi:UNVERIFIED_CONTAM: hypothetical protein FKN15_040011 [Acipenser sinensis]
MSGQTLTDRIAAAQYSVTGSAVARAVCKATTHEVMGPKKKHLEFWCTLGLFQRCPLICQRKQFFGRCDDLIRFSLSLDMESTLPRYKERLGHQSKKHRRHYENAL